MPNRLRNLLTALLVFLLCLHTTSVLAVPALPSSFYGNVKYNGSNVPDGTLVEALIDDQVVAKGYTQTYKGNSVYSVDVRGDDTDTSAHDGGIEGDDVHFQVGGLAAAEIGGWHSGTNVKLDLTVESSTALNAPQSIPTAIATQTPLAFGQAVKNEPFSGIFRNPAAIVLAVILVSLLFGVVWFFRKKVHKQG